MEPLQATDQAADQAGVAVHLRDLSHSYGGSSEVLKQINFAVQAGEFVTLLGPSGCGKSTLLKIIAGLVSPEKGSVEIAKQSSYGFVFQEPNLLPWRSVRRNIGLPMELKGLPESMYSKEVERVLDLVQLGDYGDYLPGQLSGGMKMRVSVARALVTRPKLLLLDEPFSALDEQTRQSLQEHLRQLWLQVGMTILFVTHSISEATYLSDRAIILSNSGGVLADHRIELPRNRESDLRLEPSFIQEIKRINRINKNGIEK